MIEGHGDDLYRYGGKIRLNFSSNIYQHADLQALKDYLAQRLDVVGNYPEPQPRTLERMIARRLNLSADSVMVTNGATDAIYLIAQLYRGCASVIPQPTFSEYADACRVHRHLISYERADELTRLPEDRVYWICNPNNPSGNVLMKDFVSYVIRRMKRYVFVVDQSYETYTQEPLLVPSEMQDCTNLLLLHSLTKQFCVPGLRLGYVTAHPTLIQRLRQLRQPWSVNALAIEAGKFLLSDEARPAVTDMPAYLAEARRLQAELSKIKGLRVFDSKCNFMLVETDPATSADLKQYLIHNYGILIRDCSNFYGLSNHFFRVAAQTPEEDDQLIAAIKTYLNGIA